MDREVCVPQHAMGVSTPGSGRVHTSWTDTPLGRHPHELATETGSTHPTGMHSY